MQRSFEENLNLYAKLIVGEGLALAPRQELLIFAEIDQALFVRLVVAEGYRAGAKNVEVLWSDPQTVLTRYCEGSDEAIATTPNWLYDGITRAHRENAARLAISSSDPGLLASVDPQRVAISSRARSRSTKETSNLVSGDHINCASRERRRPVGPPKSFPDCLRTKLSPSFGTPFSSPRESWNRIRSLRGQSTARPWRHEGTG